VRVTVTTGQEKCMNALDYEYGRRVGYAMSFSHDREQSKFLKLYAVLSLLTMAIGAALVFAT
jgi:hypothetical protein